MDTWRWSLPACPASRRASGVSVHEPSAVPCRETNMTRVGLGFPLPSALSRHITARQFNDAYIQELTRYTV